MMATVLNAVRLLLYVTIIANSDPNKRKPDPPESYPIPDADRLKAEAPPEPGSFKAMLLEAKRRKAVRDQCLKREADRAVKR